MWVGCRVGKRRVVVEEMIMGKGVENRGGGIIFVNGFVVMEEVVMVFLVVVIYCLEDCWLEKEVLVGIVEFWYVGLVYFIGGWIEEVVVVVV